MFSISAQATCRPRWAFPASTRMTGCGRRSRGNTHPQQGDGGRRRAAGFRFQSWLLRLGVRYLTGGSDVGYILSAGRADVKQLRELKL